MRHLTILSLLLFPLLLALPGQAPPPVRAVNLTHTCVMCHTSHSAKSDRLLRGRGIDGMCLSCHGPGGGSALQAAAHARAMNLNQGAPKSCTACHPPHGKTIQTPQFVPMRPPGWQPPGLFNP